MIRAIVRSSLRFRLLIVALAVGVMVAGVVQLRDAPVDVLPEFTPPYAEIQTEALGLSADEVEQLITVPLEADLLNGVEGVEVIRSESLPGLSSIVLVFEQGTDIYRARQLVEERLTQAHALPHVSEAPTLLQPLSSSSRVLMIGLSSDTLSPIERSLIARWTLRPRLMGVPGVANVAIWGQRDEQLQVQVDPEQLRDRDVTLSQVIRTAGNAQVVSPLSFLEGSTPGTGGFIETPQQRLQVRNVFDKIADPKELGKVPVEGAAGRLRLADVSDIQIGHQPLIGDAVVGDGDGLILVVEKFPGASTPEVTEGVEEALDELEPALSGLRTDTSIFRPASLIEDAIDNLTLTIAIAAALLTLILVALLLQWRTVAIALATIPVSLTGAALVLDLLGESFNAISFAGLAAAVAIVIDEAVVSAENVARRLPHPGRERGGALDAISSPGRHPRDARPPGVCLGHRPARDGAPRSHGGSAGRLLRAAGALVCARRGDGDARRPHRRPGAQPDAVLEGHGRRTRVRAPAGSRTALSRRAPERLRSPEGRADRRRRHRGGGTRRAAATRYLRRALVQGP